MQPIAFASSNPDKFAIAQTVCGKFDIEVQQVFLDIDEIQGEDPELIVKHKAQAAYTEYGKPIVVSDDSWAISALKGFPGAYMKSMNYWLMADDWLRLMKGVSDRTIVLQQYLAYADGHQIVVFSNDIPGVLLESPKGKNDRSRNMEVITLDGDNGKSIAEVFETGGDAVVERYRNRNDVWHEFVKWYKEQ